MEIFGLILGSIISGVIIGGVCNYIVCMDFDELEIDNDIGVQIEVLGDIEGKAIDDNGDDA